MTPTLVYCANGNPVLARAAVAAGWLYGARLPGHVGAGLEVWFADQDYRSPDRAGYMAALAKHRPACASVLDWEHPDQLDEVLSWAEEAAQYVREAVLLVPKVSGGIPLLPRAVGGKRVVLGYSVPSGYGASPLWLGELAGWPVHLLGGSPHRQMCLWRDYFRGQVVSVDCNIVAWHARRGRSWQRQRGRTSHWWQLRDLGDTRNRDVPLECFRRSLVEVRLAWEALTADECVGVEESADAGA
jgi:hypothetical protein